MTKLLATLSGYKTYIVCAITIAFAIYQLVNHAIDANSFSDMVLVALGAAGLRNGMTTTVVQAAATIIATRNPAVATSTQPVNAVSDAVVSGALDHAATAGAPSITIPATATSPEVVIRKQTEGFK